MSIQACRDLEQHWMAVPTPRDAPAVLATYTRKSRAGVRARAIAISASAASSPHTSAPRPAATLAA